MKLIKTFIFVLFKQFEKHPGIIVLNENTDNNYYNCNEFINLPWKDIIILLNQKFYIYKKYPFIQKCLNNKFTILGWIIGIIITSVLGIMALK